MVLACHRHGLAAAALLLFCGSPTQIVANTITTAPLAAPTSISNGTCEFRTINYITDTLPQLCLRSSWSQSNATLKSAVAGNTTTTNEGQTAESSPSSDIEPTNGSPAASNLNSSSEISPGTPAPAAASTVSISTESAQASATEVEVAVELNDAAFLSFEEWKKQTLEKAGQANTNIGNRRSGENKRRDSASFQNDLDTLGDEGEIDLDFGSFGGRENGEEALHKLEKDSKTEDDTQIIGGRSRGHSRNKDAGKTCKERFSYASFDAGATILKTHQGAKHAKAVLIENKDSYMLSECSIENKFIIIELSEDIWIDTLVLANYEFFSSMIRTFRVSVSDRYPIKVEKWKDVGTYEARNSREIQAFLIENPQIWARYLRIEFLTHYGNEYYCPLSLVRVHGTRMLESWKESEASEEENEAIETGPGERFVPEAVAEVVMEEERQQHAQGIIDVSNETVKAITQAHEKSMLNATRLLDTNNTSQPAPVTPWPKDNFLIFFNTSSSLLVCLPTDGPPESILQPTVHSSKSSSNGSNGSSKSLASPSSHMTASPAAPIPPEQLDNYTISERTSVTSSPEPSLNSSNNSISVSNSPITSPTPTSIASKPPEAAASQKVKSSSTSSSSAALPTIQESFFKAVSRRLQLLESNSTLSLQYIEEQSKTLREAFMKVEKKQLQKTTVFLDTLNSTVLDQLHGFRQQYDEIWQSTVISLESQRDESRREILAISSRLNILADEVIFQKRMSIVQSVLLLLCLGLVIFSRVAGGGIDLPRIHSRPRHFPEFQTESPLDSAPDSPCRHRIGSVRTGRRWLEIGHRRQQSDETAESRSRSRDLSPPTPISSYTRSADFSQSPPLGVDGTGEHINGLIQRSSSSSSSPRKKRRCSSQQNDRRSPNNTNGSFTSATSSASYTGSHSEENNEMLYDPSRSVLPSPPPEEGHENHTFGTAQKPLPALPVDGG